MSRTKKSLRNIAFTLIGSIVTLLLQLLNRKVFVNFLSSEYLGLNGLFSNILSMLSLSEMGIGTAMIFALYKPVAEKDNEKCKSLMALYKKYYTIIGCFVLAVGSALAPFLQVFVKEMPDIPWIRLYYLMFVIDSGLSYFYSYKRSYLLCNQENYISSVTTMGASIASRLVQLILLITTHNYFLFLLTQILFTRLENVLISKIAEKKYPFLLEKDIQPLDSETNKEIKKNIFAMFAHKIGNVIVNGTDNLIISKILGLGILGVFSNYSLLFTNVSSIISKVFNSVTSSVGNLTVEKKPEEAEKVFQNMLFANFSIYCVCSTCFCALIQPFVNLWLGKGYLLSDATVYILVAVFYFNGMRLTALDFRDATGVFYNDRYKALIESVVNIALSIPFTFLWGVAGVKLGTLISTLTTSFWIEGYVLYKHYFKEGMGKYYFKQFIFALLSFLICFITCLICKRVDNGSIVTFLFECILAFCFPCIVIFVVFFKTEESKFWRRKVKLVLNSRKNRGV